MIIIRPSEVLEKLEGFVVLSALYSHSFDTKVRGKHLYKCGCTVQAAVSGYLFCIRVCST